MAFFQPAKPVRSGHVAFLEDLLYSWGYSVVTHSWDFFSGTPIVEIILVTFPKR